MKTRGLIIPVIILLIIFCGCKKYPEDPYIITFRSVQTRLLGTWQIEEFKIDETSSVGLFNNTENVLNVKIDKSEPEDHVDGDIVRIADVYGVWYYEDYQKKLKFQFYEQENDSSCFYFGPFADSLESIWIIQKLTMEELWLETDYNSKNYKLFLKK